MGKIKFILLSFIILLGSLSFYCLNGQRQELKEREIFISNLQVEINELEKARYEDNQNIIALKKKNYELNDEKHDLEEINIYLIENVKLYKAKAEHLDNLFEDMFLVRATKYAPLDPNAIEGVCFSGNPNITASGERSDTELSIAADPSIPFGKEVLVEGFGPRIVHDRGGAIKGNRIDIMVDSKKEAYSFGYQELNILILD